jgi:hypothetical protein
MFIKHEWLSEHGQIAKLRLSDRCGGETIPVTMKVGYCRGRFEDLMGNLGKEVKPAP